MNLVDDEKADVVAPISKCGSCVAQDADDNVGAICDVGVGASCTFLGDPSTPPIETELAVLNPFS
jgi:hypothetical protein